MGRASALACVVLATLGACTFTASLSDQARTAVADTVRIQAEAFVAALAARDADKLAGLFTADSDFVYVDQGKMYPDRQALRDAAAGFFGRLRTASGRWDRQHILVQGLGAAAFTGVLRADIVDTLGQPQWTEGKVWTLIYERRDGRWEIIQAHETNARP